MNKTEIAVIGGGASGIMAAIQGAVKGAKVTIYEKNDRIGKKILATGNGKCNFSNTRMDESCYYSNALDKVMESVELFDEKDCRSFFQSLGMLVKEKNGYLYPASEQASTVLDLLRLKLVSLNVKVITDCEIKSIQKTETYFVLTGEMAGKTEEYHAQKVIVSAGTGAGTQKGKKKDSFSLLKDFNFFVFPQVPGLVPLRVKEDYMKAVAGVRVEGVITLYINEKEIRKERGEIQLTDYGVSGIPTFQLSRFASYALLEKKKVKVEINILPDLPEKEFQKYMEARTLMYKDETAEEFLLGVANKKINLLLLKLSQIRPQDKVTEVSKEKMKLLISLFHKWVLTVVATNPLEMAQVCAGGIDMNMIGKGMEAVSVPGLYVTGELLDVDGRCGGYNLQWAFTSGYLAGQHAASSCGED